MGANKHNMLRLLRGSAMGAELTETNPRRHSTVQTLDPVRSVDVPQCVENRLLCGLSRVI